MKKYVIIVAGGDGKRFGGDTPKQFLLLNNKPLLLHTLEKYYNYSDEIAIILVLPKEHINFWNTTCYDFRVKIPHLVVEGGKERFFSVKNGLQEVPYGAVVAVHDGVRPFVSEQTIKKCFDTAVEKNTAVPITPVNDSIRQIEGQNSIALNRLSLKAVQTPQVFLSDILKKAYEEPFLDYFTDDASVVEAIGEKINLVEGNLENIKITTPFDFLIAEHFILKEQKNNKTI